MLKSVQLGWKTKSENFNHTKEAALPSHMVTVWRPCIILIQEDMWFGVKQFTASRNWQFKTHEEGKCP